MVARFVDLLLFLILGKLEESFEDGESPYQAEVRAVNKLYDIILDQANGACKSIVFILHGRLLRIILASILDKDLTCMSKYTHHNTTGKFPLILQ